MSENKLSTISILLLVVGLVFGFGGGYMYVSGQMNPVIEELDMEYQALVTEHESLAASKTLAETEYNELEDDLSNIEDEVSQLSLDIVSQSLMLLVVNIL